MKTKSDRATRGARRMSYRAAAKELGVDVGHLWHVINGDRVSRRIEREMRKRRIVIAGKEVA